MTGVVLGLLVLAGCGGGGASPSASATGSSGGATVAPTTSVAAAPAGPSETAAVGATSAPASGTPDPALRPTSRDRFGTRVRYPTYGGKPLEVFWPVPGSGLRWVLEGATLTTDNAPVALAQVSERLARGVGARAHRWNGVGWTRDGVDLGGRLESDLVDGDRTGSLVVAVTPGGAVRDGEVWDVCGTWPDATTGLGTPDGPAPAVGEVGRRTCGVTLVVLPEHVVNMIHAEFADERGQVGARQVFVVRPDGVAVSIRVSLHGGGEEGLPPLRRLPSWFALDDAALTVVQPVVRM